MLCELDLKGRQQFSLSALVQHDQLCRCPYAA
jgi:hypothetical protein